MHVNLLGPVEAVSDDGAIGLGGVKQRAVLAMLALQTGSTVSADRLIDGLWGDHPPASALKLVQLYVSHLRKAFGEEDVIATHGRGYELRLARQDVDAGRFERLLAQGAAREALRLWRGSPLADVAGEPFAAPEIRRLQELHTAALEVAIDQDLDAGRHREVLPEIDGLLAAEPLREPLHARRMLALYRCGRQADALEAYREVRRALIEEIGVEPGPALRALHESILRQDPALDPPVDGSRRTPLFGREQELERLRALWRRVRDGSAATALISGEPGIGKTRLALALADDVRREGGDVSWGDLQALAPGRPSLLVLDGAGVAPQRVPSVLVLMTIVEPDGIVADERVALGALGPDEAARLARFDAGDDEPVGRIVDASRCVPGLIREAARDWARAQAMARVADAAARTSADRAQLQLAEGDLTLRVVEFQGIREPASATPGACPYKGLETFDVEDAAVFFGRERLVAELVARLPGARLLGIVGPSGSGKSSAMRAGLLAAIGAGVLPGSETWAQAVIRPGERPTLPEPPAGWAVLAVDQFEELFTVCRDEGERAAFVAALLDRARHDTIVIVAVRADFYGACARYPELSRLLGANHVLVGPMQRHELRRAVELPAGHAGVAIEPGLADNLVADVEQEPGALPLLSTALFALWDEGLTLDAYERTGGVRGAVARLAEAAYARLDDGGRAEARRILLRLAGDGDVRTRVPLAELGDGAVLSALARDRLVTVGEGEAEVAHEALLREWPRLVSWLEEDAEGRRLHRHLTQAARDWNGDPSELYRGPRLAAALEWADAHGSDLTARERSFLAAGRAAGEQAQRRLRLVLGGVATLLVLAVIAGAIAINQRGHAREAAVAADAQRVGAQALTAGDLDRELLLARQGVALDDSLQTRGNLLAALLKSPAAIGVLRGDGDGLISLDLSPDERTLAFIDIDGTVTFVDRRTHRRAAPPAAVGGQEPCLIVAQVRLDHLRFSPDGSRLAVGGCSPVILDARTHRVLARLRVPDEFIYTLRFSPDGRTLFAAVGRPLKGDTALVRFDARSGRPLGPERSAGEGLGSFMLTRDGRRVVTSFEGATVIRDAGTLRPLRSLPVGAETAALSPDGHTVLLGGSDGSVRFLDLVSGKVRTGSGRHEGAVVKATFNADGASAITAGQDDRVIVWDVKRAEAGETLEGHGGQVTGLAISHDNQTLYSSALDGKVLIWDLAGTRRLGRPFGLGTGGATLRYALSPDGRVLAAGHADGTVTLIDARTLTPLSGPVRVLRDGPVGGMGFVPHSRLLVVGDSTGFVTLLDSERRQVIWRRRAGDAPIFTPGFSADGRLLATASDDFNDREDGVVRLWALPSGREIGGPLKYPSVEDVSLSPDGRTLAITAGIDRKDLDKGDVEIVDAGTHRRRASLPETETVTDLARFTPDGRFIVAGSWKGWARLWSTKTFKPATRPFVGHAGRVEWESISPDGRTLATGGPEGAIRLWDLPTQRPLGAPLPALPNHEAVPQFTPDGNYLFAITDAGRAYRWDMRGASWAQHACDVAGRTLTRTEWNAALPDRAYAPACAH
ncbi:AAA family ATPase [Solirubrobacter ginsenosidimutans]|uniref:AAA family ATPase n=1 Tax=Solirubrobacter ginsenosidimutans TaxID=490573 RepID=A0A9X3S025_9ACTN|nr:BTAD domain-containing putative transcriptional regulator [Solirubrobacter ginsenosidimutans]MDA0158851.1 AAA family ATPase [Solirubrobacter ginsenosidimutans]